VYTFVVTLHVLAAVLLMGPFALAGFWGHRAIQRRDADNTRDAARFMARFGLGSLLVALLGVGALASSTKYTFRTPWVIISLTLYVVAMGIATGYTVPAMRKAAALIEAGAAPPDRPAPVAGEGDIEGDAPQEPAGFSAAGEAARERINGIAGRVIGSGALVALLIAAITILMVTRPFGR
jgi:uncharacterized membrane protein